MMNNDIDPNKKITPFTDCKGTCKTPIGCTCGKRKPKDDEIEDRIKAEIEYAEDQAEQAAETAVEANNSCGCKCKKGGKTSCCMGKNKLEVYDWFEEMPPVIEESKMVEVQFKNTRKGYYLNSNDLDLYKGDIVAVEATPGHDIGEVTLTGKLVELQMKKTNFRGEIKRVYRKAKASDMEKYDQAKAKEHQTMLRAREIAEELKLEMKISDVEYQGDGNKAIFYYIADGRVDFRQLIKLYASEFRIKIEMKQIGARQEAGRVGGIGPCGRELCCSGYMSNFVSVSTQAARLQDIPLNPQKLAGQCGKLKCCLNFEVDTYVEAQRSLPSRDLVLETKDSFYYHFKTDILSGQISYSTDKHFAANIVSISKDRVFEIMRLNKRGEKPLTLLDKETEAALSVNNGAIDVLEQESITRFDSNNGNERGGQNRKDRRKKKKPRQSDDRRDQETAGNNNTEGKEPRKVIERRNPSNSEVAQNNGDDSKEPKDRQVARNRRRNNNRPSNKGGNNGQDQPQQSSEQQQRNNRPPRNDRRRRNNNNNKERGNDSSDN